MKRVLILCGIAVLCTATAIFSNTTIMGKHKGLMKHGNVAVKSCADCHNAVSGLKQEQGQDLAKFYRTPSCGGSGCHR